MGVALPVSKIHVGELRGGIVDEQIFVVRAGQHVFECGSGRAAAEALLHMRSRRNQGQGQAPARDRPAP